MHLIAIDPGQSTGIAVFSGGRLQSTSTFSQPSELRACLRRAHRAHPFDVVCERGPAERRHQNDMCSLIEEVVRQEALSIYWLRPAEWKRHPSARLSEHELRLVNTRHERDAAGMGKCFISNGGHYSQEQGGASVAAVRS